MSNTASLGLVSISFRKHSPKEILEAMKEAGLSQIEWGSDVHAPCHDTARLDELVSLQREWGITCSSYGTYFKFGKHSVDELEDYILAAKRLGTDVLRLWCGTASGADMTEEERQTLLADCRRAAALAERHGVTLCMECHRKTFTERLSDALLLMEQVHSEHFRMYWQPFQWRTAEENEAYAREIAPHVCHVHVFQWKGEDAFSLWEGIEEWRRYLACLPTHGALLLEFMPNGQLTELKREADALREIIGGQG